MKIKRTGAADIRKTVATKGADAEALRSLSFMFTVILSIKGADAEAVRPLSLMKGNK